MSREEFLKELEYLLADLEEEEREEALDYYRDYLEESGDLTPEEIAGRLGSPEKVAAEIKGSLWGDDRGGEFTERGYEDTRYKEKEQIPDSYGQIVETGEVKGKRGRRRRDSEKRRQTLLIVLLVIFFGIPAAGSLISAGFSVVFGILGGILGIFGGLFGLVFAAFGAAIGFLAGGIEMVIQGGSRMASPAYGTMMIGSGFFMFALALVAALLGKWGCSTLIPALFRFIFEQIGRLWRWLGKTFRRFLGKGGASR